LADGLVLLNYYTYLQSSPNTCNLSYVVLISFKRLKDCVMGHYFLNCHAIC